jgi:hypothetical protein
MEHQANQYVNLKQRSGFPFPVYFSPGLNEQRIQETAERCERAWQFLNDTFQMTARIGVVVLAPEHWAEYGSFPVYGMPHILDSFTLVIAGENNDMWRSMVPPLEHLPPPVSEGFEEMYPARRRTFRASGAGGRSQPRDHGIFSFIAQQSFTGKESLCHPTI